MLASSSNHWKLMKTGNWHDCVVLIIFSAIILSFSICWSMDKLDIKQVVTFLQMDRDRSYLEGKTYETFPKATLSSFTAGDYQSSIEKFINDRVPFRDSLLLFNAAWQRWLISLSACAHEYAVFPTFYGSSYCYDANHDALYATLKFSTASDIEQYEAAADGFSSLSSRYHDINFYFYRVDRLSSSNNNPTNQLQNNVINTDFLTKHFFNRISGISVIESGLLDDQEQSLQVYYRSDHHWNGLPAYYAFTDMIKVMRPDAEAPSELTELRFSDPVFQGSCARAALCPVKEPDLIDDYYIDMSDYRVFVNDEEWSTQSLQHLDNYLNGDWGSDSFTNRYAEYWHSDFPVLKIENTQASSSKSLLIFRDSYSAPLERYFGTYYKTVYAVDLRHYEGAAGDFISSLSSDDDVLFLMGSTTFSNDSVLSRL